MSTTEPPVGPSRGSNRTILIVVLVVAAVGAVAFIGTRQSNDSGGKGSGANTSTTKPPGPTYRPSLAAPSGWHLSADGRVAARDQADLTAKVPAGPRLTMRLDVAPTDVASIQAAMGKDDTVAIKDPVNVSIDGHRAVAISFIEGPFNDTELLAVTYESVRTSDHTAVLFVLEVPSADFDKLDPAMRKIPRLTKT